MDNKDYDYMRYMELKDELVKDTNTDLYNDLNAGGPKVIKSKKKAALKAAYPDKVGCALTILVLSSAVLAITLIIISQPVWR